MITKVLMPKFTERMTQGVLLSWKLEEGQAVAPGDVLAEIETDTAVMELEANGSGFLRHILINEGASVKTGTVVAVIGDLDDDIGSTLKEIIKRQKMAKIDPKPTRKPSLSSKRPHIRREEPGAAQKSRTATLPTASSLSDGKESIKTEYREQSSNPADQSRDHVIEETETNTIIEEATPVVEEVLEVLGDILENTGEHMKEPKNMLDKGSTQNDECAPSFHLTTEIRVAEAERLREQMMDIQRTSLSFTTLYARAATLAFARHQEFQAACFGCENGSIDIGVAITMEDRILTPLLRNCGRKNIAELSDEIQEVTQQTRAHQCVPEESSEALFTIANFGMYPVEQFIPILSSSQTASLAIGAVRNAQLPEGEIVTADRHVTVSLSCNRKILDEDHAAQFLESFKQILERPLEIFLPNPVE